MNNKIYRMLLTGLLLFAMVENVFAYRTPENTDGDLLADELEQWLLDRGVATDDDGVGISPSGMNTYLDSDGDTIPDIIEANLTLTDPTVDDLQAKNCPGDGTVNFSSQRALRIYQSGSLESGHNLFTQYLTTLSICHMGAGSISAFNPFFGYTDPTMSSFTETSSGSGVYNMALTWGLEGGDKVAFTSTVSATTFANISGNMTVSNGSGTATATLPFRSSRQAVNVQLNRINGVVGMQTKVMDDSEPLANTLNNPRNPGTRVGHIMVNPEGGADTTAYTLFYTDVGDVLPGYFVPSVGSLFIASAETKSDSVKETVEITAIFGRDLDGSRAPSNGSMFRGEIHTKWEAGGAVIKEQHENFYARHGRAGEGQPELLALTVMRPDRTFTRLTYLNVRLGADTVTVTGPNGFSSTLLDVGMAGLGLVDKVRVRNRVPGFVDNPAIGIAGGDGGRRQIRASLINFQPAGSAATQILANGAYTVTSEINGGGAAAQRTRVGNYTASTQAYSVVSNVTFNGIAWNAGTDITNVGVNASHTINFNHAHEANTDRYRLIIQRTDEGELNPFDAGRLLIQGGSSSLSINTGILDPGASYCLRIQARNSIDRTLRSETNKLCFDTATDPNSTSPGDGGTSQGATLNGSWQTIETVTSANGVCSGEVGSENNYTVDFTQSGNSLTAFAFNQSFNGTITGNQININGSRPEDGGITTFSLNGALTDSCLQGTIDWSWTDGVQNCSMGKSTFETTPTNNVNACLNTKSGGNTSGGGTGGGGTGGGGSGGGGLAGLWFLGLLTAFALLSRRKRYTHGIIRHHNR